MRKTGIENIWLSILSKIPPWPGNKLPLSFTLAERFNIDSIKSPITEHIHTIAPKISHSDIFIDEKYWLSIYEPIRHNIKPPPTPSQVFFGDIRSSNLCFPKFTPAK